MKRTVEGLPVVELGVERASGRVVVQMDEAGVVLLEYFSDEDAVGEVPREVALGPAEGDAVDPLEQLLHFVLVDRGCLHQRTINIVVQPTQK
jgi:hypothetical protein